jgi:hypothetical protein
LTEAEFDEKTQFVSVTSDWSSTKIAPPNLKAEFRLNTLASIETVALFMNRAPPSLFVPPAAALLATKAEFDTLTIEPSMNMAPPELLTLVELVLPFVKSNPSNDSFEPDPEVNLRDPVVIVMMVRALRPSSLHLDAISEQVTATALEKQRETYGALLHVPLNVESGVKMMASPLSALSYASCREDVVTVIEQLEAPAELMKPTVQVKQSELLSWSVVVVARSALYFPEGHIVHALEASDSA